MQKFRIILHPLHWSWSNVALVYDYTACIRAIQHFICFKIGVMMKWTKLDEMYQKLTRRLKVNMINMPSMIVIKHQLDMFDLIQSVHTLPQFDQCKYNRHIYNKIKSMLLIITLWHLKVKYDNLYIKLDTRVNFDPYFDQNTASHVYY